MSLKNRNIVLAVGFLVVLVICYRLAISNTLQKYGEYQQLKQQEVLFKNAPRQLVVLKRQQIYYDSILKANHISGNSMQGNLFRNLETYASKNDLSIYEFLEPHTAPYQDASLRSYIFGVQGDFNKILKMVHGIEQRTKFGELIHVGFEKKKNLRTGKQYLRARLILQRIE